MATGDPVTRRVIFGTYVIPTYSIEGEEASVRHTEFQASPAGTLGGKGTASIDEDQWGDGWVSFAHHTGAWEDQGDLWNVQGETWDGTLGLTTGGVDLTDDTSACKFLYIKNTGDTNEVVVALDGGTNYYIIIPAGGSTQLRGDGTQLLCNEVYVKCNGGEASTIEYLVAKA